MDLVYHAILRMFDGKAFFAPVKNPQRIVDMGTGTGIWALDVGDQYPEAHVVGIDLSPIQPKWYTSH
jgi:methylase of polypeptide subunit release factors